MDKKYEFTGKTRNGLQQIRRISDGLVGGWIESEENLSHEGSCFVSDDARVYNKARVYGNAEVYDNARLYENAEVFRNAQVFGNAWIYGRAKVSGVAEISGNAEVCGNARVYKRSEIICISGLQFHITVTPQNAVIGCQLKTHSEWLKVTKEEAMKMGLDEGEYERVKLALTTGLSFIFPALAKQDYRAAFVAGWQKYGKSIG